MTNTPKSFTISGKHVQHELIASEIDNSDQPFQTTTAGEKLTYALIKVKFSPDEDVSARTSDRYAELHEHLTSLKSDLGEGMHFKMEKLTETCLSWVECAPVTETTKPAV
ncbi:MAG: hypothetical protein ABJL72_18095 [Roseobacter sp.]